MAIRGSLSEASLPDVLQLLAMGQKTGCLSVTDRSHFGYIYFDQGRISYASIVNRRDRLGDLLIKNRVLDPEELAAAIEEQGGRPEQRLGEILIARGIITREQLEHYIRIQIEEAVYFLFTWSQGTFSFESGRRPDDGAMLVSINPENLLLEGARRVDEWTLIEKKIPSLDLIFQLDRERAIPPELALTSEQKRISPLLDGRYSVREIIEETGLGEFEVGKALFGLIQAGFATRVGRRQAREVNRVPAARVREHRNLGVAFYRTAMYEEAIREFRRVLELQPGHAEARFYLGLIELRRDDNRGAVRFFKEYVERTGPHTSALHDLALALERLERHENARAASEEALRLAPERDRVLLSHAVLLLKTGRVREAAGAFARYRAALGPKQRPAATYFAFAVLAEAAIGRSPEAVRLGEEGIALYPHSAPLLLHLGAVRERRGEWEAAEALYRRAAEEDVRLPQAHKALGDALFQRGANDEAAEAYRYAVQLAPNLGDDVYLKLGNILYKRRERGEAMRLWRRALELNPYNAVARTNLELVETALTDSGAAALLVTSGSGPDRDAAGDEQEAVPEVRVRAV